MNDVAELFKRTEHLRSQVDALRGELEQVRRDLSRLQSSVGVPEMKADRQMPDCLALAIDLAEDLGPGFSSETPHDLADRGGNWLDVP